MMDELDEWRRWRRLHYADGTPRPEGSKSPLLERMLLSRKASEALREADNRFPEQIKARQVVWGIEGPAGPTFNRQQHEMTVNCERWHCYWHQVDERPSRRKGATVCGECWHTFPSRADLRKTHFKMVWEMFWSKPSWGAFMLLLTARWRKIWSCPFCAHDF